jgi:hypothetical protein
MIGVSFDPESLDDARRSTWAKLADQAAKARATLRPADFKSDVWAGIKEWMFENVFHGKCAYCEGDVRPVAFGDGEHWRPKAGVTVRREGKDCKVADESGEPHTGYYWLAYDWRNLLPACQECNSGSKGFRGKGTQFPINGRRVFRPDEADTLEELNEIEQPLLLHPFFDDPLEHLAFDEHGQPIAKNGSERGKHSIEVLNLNRPWLNTKRKALHDALRKQVKLLMAAQLNGGPNAAVELREQMSPVESYSLARRIYITHWYDQIRKQEFNERP